MITREIAPRLQSLFRQYPFVTVTGPRQSGKTTLCRETFPELAYANLEAPDQREFAEADPRGFLDQLGYGSIIDEAQRVPSLLSYLQVLADERRRNGLFVITGSEQFRLSEAISQSLAGRVAQIRLLPFSIAERRRIGASEAVDEMIFSGFYPRLLDQALEPRQALGDYFETYVERDVRRLGQIRNLTSFRRFVRLCAGRVGQLANLSALGADAGVSHTTAREWLTLLETSFIVFQLPPHHANIRKRLVKSPKLYFTDVGLACYLVGIERAKQVATHPLRGGLFENLVVAEALKHRFNRGREPNLSFFRESRGLECDLLYETGEGVAAIEIKSGATVSSDWFPPLSRVAHLLPDVNRRIVAYGGTARQSRNDVEVVPVGELGGLLERIDVSVDVGEFVDRHDASVPNSFDIATLDTTLIAHIRPALDDLDAALRPLGAKLFRSYVRRLHCRVGAVSRHSLDLFTPEGWERTKSELIDVPGFRFSDSQHIELWSTFELVGYGGIGGDDGKFIVAIAWAFGSGAASRRATINDSPIEELDATIPYADLARRSAETHLIVARVLQGLMSELPSPPRRGY